MAKFQLSIPKLLKWEGGYVNDPLDPGGETNFGITQKTWTADRKNWINPPPESVKNIEKTHAEIFYLHAYWTPLSLRLIDSQEVADALFSFAINQGAGKAVKRMQWLVNVPQDGKVGPGTLAAINALPGPKLCNDYCDATKAYFEDLIKRRPALAKFKNGWFNRVNDYRVKI